MITRLQAKKAFAMGVNTDEEILMDAEEGETRIESKPRICSMRKRLHFDSLRSSHDTREPRRRSFRSSNRQQTSTNEHSCPPQPSTEVLMNPTNNSITSLCSTEPKDTLSCKENYCDYSADKNNNNSRIGIADVFNSQLHPPNHRLEVLSSSSTTQSLSTSTTSSYPLLLSSSLGDKHCSPVLPKSFKQKSCLLNRCRLVKQSKGSRIRKVKSQEYKKLRKMVPALQERNRVSKVMVIEEAIKYIDELHSTLVQRFRAKNVPTTFNGVRLDPQDIHRGNIRELVRKLLANANPGSLPPARIENVRNVPTFIQKLSKHKK